MTPRVARIDHVQLAMPPGQEVEAIGFYAGLLGLEHVEKPPVLAARGGCWFRLGEVELHLGVEEPFVPARKAHPALVVDGYDEFLVILASVGVDVRPDTSIEGVTRCHVDDPFGNRIELIAEPSPR